MELCDHLYISAVTAVNNTDLSGFLEAADLVCVCVGGGGEVAYGHVELCGNLYISGVAAINSTDLSDFLKVVDLMCVCVCVSVV